MRDPQFDSERKASIRELIADRSLRELAASFIVASARHKYSYNFDWLGLPIIQLPQDVVAVQEIVWRVKPEVIVETGVARGGSLALSASLLQLLGRGFVVGVDIEIRPDNRVAIETHPLSPRIRLVEGSSVDESVVAEIFELVGEHSPVVLLLDSSHTHQHVLSELRLYSPLVTVGSYIVVFDTVIADMPAGSFPDRPWTHEDNPKTAVAAFLAENDRFVIDTEMEATLQITSAASGFLQCVS